MTRIRDDAIRQHGENHRGVRRRGERERKNTVYRKRTGTRPRCMTAAKHETGPTALAYPETPVAFHFNSLGYAGRIPTLRGTRWLRFAVQGTGPRDSVSQEMCTVEKRRVISLPRPKSENTQERWHQIITSGSRKKAKIIIC